MNIFVYGTLPKVDDPKSTELKEYCRSLGKLTAECGHTIVAVSSIDVVVDTYFLEGMEAAKYGGNAIICRSNDPDFPFHEDKFRNISLTLIDNLGQLNNSHINALQNSNIALTVAGTHHLDTEIGYQAMILQKPILPIPFYGHAAKRVWESVFPVYKAKGYLTEQEISDLNKQHDRVEPGSVISILEKFSQRHHKLSTKNVSPGMVCFLTVVMMTLWIIAFLNPSLLGFSYEAAFFVLIGCSSIFGILLRVARKMLFDEIRGIPKYKLMAEASMALILGFVFSLLWVINNFVVTGKTLSFDESIDFARAAIVCSLITLTASYYLENSINKIRNVINTMGDA